VRGRRCAQSGCNSFQYTRRIAQHFVVPESHDPIAVFDEPTVSQPILLTVCVLSAVNLNDHPSLPADKIDNIGTDRFLPHKLVAFYRSRPKSLP
jgi:hypothetical protein